MDKYLGKLQSKRTALIWEDRARELGLFDIAALLSGNRWRTVAARPTEAEQMYRIIHTTGE